MDPHTNPGLVAAEFAERQQALEEQLLSPLAARSWPAHRLVDEADCGLRSPLQRDRDRIVHCKAFRRLKHKTQVFVSPEGDHYRTRLTHTIEVTQIARTVARALRLNEDLTEAIGLGHETGELHEIVQGVRCDQERGLALVGRQGQQVVEFAREIGNQIVPAHSGRDGIVHLLLHVDRLGEGAQVQANDRALQPTPSLARNLGVGDFHR